MKDFTTSLARAYSHLAARSDLLDRINVFPVADCDTGTNLRISLAPFRDHADVSLLREQLARSATGNSGNIAAAFFQEFCLVQTGGDLAEKTISGRERAWRAVNSPRKGTMLSVFDALSLTLASHEEKDDLW